MAVIFSTLGWAVGCVKVNTAIMLHVVIEHNRVSKNKFKV